MHGMNEAQKAHFESEKKKLEKMKVEAENLMKRLRGEEVESDEEVEGDLDLVPSKFEAEHAPKPEQVEQQIKSLLAVVDPESARDYKLVDNRQGPNPDTDPSIRAERSVPTNGKRRPETAEEYIEYLRMRGAWR
jgi:hypothetical protein